MDEWVCKNECAWANVGECAGGATVFWPNTNSYKKKKKKKEGRKMKGKTSSLKQATKEWFRDSDKKFESSLILENKWSWAKKQTIKHWF